jgi:peptide/nickel transport system permease protein
VSRERGVEVVSVENPEGLFEGPVVPPDLGGKVELSIATDAVSPWKRIFHRFRRNRVAMVALAFIVLMVLVAVFAPLLAPYPPKETSSAINQTPSAEHLLGTDDVGRDILSDVMYGARVSLAVGALTILMAATVAIPIGLFTGYAGGWVDSVTGRLMEALMTVPGLVLALVIAALLGSSIPLVSLAIAIPFVPGYVRLLRASVLAVREETFIEASRAVGVSRRRMIAKHVLPNVASPLIVQIAVSFGYALLAEAGLSFLGFGPGLSWGSQLSEAYHFVLEDPWGLIPAGTAIFLTVLAFNLLGDGLRDSLGRETFVIKPEAATV